MKVVLYPIKNQSNKETRRSRLHFNEIWQFPNSESMKWWALKLQATFQLRSNQTLSLGELGFMWLNVYEFRRTNQSNNELWSYRLHLDEIWSFSNGESIQQWAWELQATFEGILMISWLGINEIMNLEAPDYIWMSLY